MALDNFSFPSLIGYPTDRDLDFLLGCPIYGFPTSYLGNRPANTERVDMNCGPADFLPHDPFGMNRFDPADLLPPDPFGMDIQNSVTAAISGLVVGLGSRTSPVPISCSSAMSEESAACYALSEMELPSSLAPVSTSGQIPDGMGYALGYLGVKDLLSVQQVCKSLYDAVEGDPLLWMSIQIDSNLSERINDETLLKVTRKAQGNLRALSLVACLNVTDEGLKCVLEENPRLTKLYVPECVRLTLDGLITNLKSFNSRNNPGIQHLKLGRLFSITESHYNELTALLNGNLLQQDAHFKPRFYHIARFSMQCNEDRALDIEVCPLCQKYRIVYDCPLKTCKGKREPCRACESCILRCVLCGKCIRDNAYIETFSFEYICTACWKYP